MKQKVTLDFETRSTCNLKTAGAYKYSLDPATRPTCLAFKIYGQEKVFLLDFKVINRKWDHQPPELRRMWESLIGEGRLFVAHNAFFEQCIYYNILVKRYGWPPIGRRAWRCTAAKAAACALPRSLEGAGEAMRLTTQKDRRGYAAMMKTCKPTKDWAAWSKIDKQKASWSKRENKIIALGEPPMFLEPDAAPEIWAALYHYCRIDVRTEELLDDALPDLNDEEQEIWLLNQKLNWRGLPVDLKTVGKIVTIMSVESKKKIKELDALTMGLVTKPGARQSILDFLALDGVELPDIRAATVTDALKGKSLSPDMRRLLELRQALSKTSTKKYQAFLDRAMPDGRVRDISLYHGASTGRESGTGIQPHNLPRPLIKQKEIEYVIELLESYGPHMTPEEIQDFTDWIRCLYGDPGMVFSSMLRNMIVPSPGHELYVADFSKIEVAVLWWLSGNAPGVNVLKSGRDPYIYMAAANTNRTYKEVETAIEGDEKWAIDARQLGKAQILGCGFGMGWEKFQSTAWSQYRLKLTEAQSRQAVETYRFTHFAVPEIWHEYETCAVQAVKHKGSVYKAGKCSFFVMDDFLWIELPSKRRLAYRDPQLTMQYREFSKWVSCEEPKVKTDSYKYNEEKKTWTIRQTEMRGPYETLEFYAVNSRTKKWGVERTWGGTLTENIVQATARDLMMPAMVRLEKAGYTALLSVHDEALTERKIGEGSLKEFTKIMCERPVWGDENLVVEAKGWRGPRYRK